MVIAEYKLVISIGKEYLLTFLTRFSHKTWRTDAFPSIFMTNAIVHAGRAVGATGRAPLLSFTSFREKI